MADSGSTDVSELAGMVDQHDVAEVRLALIRVADAWELRHGEVTIGSAEPRAARTWTYAEEAFVQRSVPGSLVARLLHGESLELDGFKVTVPAATSNATFQRVAGHVDWRPIAMPWPRTQWEIHSSTSTSSRQGGLLVGEGPTFLTYEAAFSAFFLEAPPSNQANQQPMWRVLRIDRRAWLHKVTIAADALTVQVRGTAIDGVHLELSSPTSNLVRTVGRTGRVQIGLRQGLAGSSLLLLRSGDDWLDFRYFHTPGPGNGDASVIWHQPEAELSLLIAGGEGQHVEFKQEVPTIDKSRRTVVKTIAAFASGEGGTLLFGVDDDAQVVGVDPATLDKQMLAVGNMIRDSIEPEPPHRLRVESIEGKTLLVVEVSPGGRWYAVNPAKPEFYVRRGASTPPARVDEITRSESRGRR